MKARPKVKAKPRGEGRRLVKGQGGPGRPKGSQNRSTLWQQAMDIISASSPELAEALVKAGLKGDKQATKWALEFAGEHRFTWKPVTKRETLEDIKAEMLAVQDGLAAGELTIAQAEKLQQVLESYADKILAAGGSDRRTAFEQEKLALALIQGDEKCRKAAWFLVQRFDQLQRRAIESGELSGPVEHPLVEVSRRGVEEAKAIAPGTAANNGPTAICGISQLT